jgi:hypothetical protein
MHLKPGREGKPHVFHYIVNPCGPKELSSRSEVHSLVACLEPRLCPGGWAGQNRHVKDGTLESKIAAESLSTELPNTHPIFPYPPPWPTRTCMRLNASFRRGGAKSTQISNPDGPCTCHFVAVRWGQRLHAHNKIRDGGSRPPMLHHESHLGAGPRTARNNIQIRGNSKISQIGAKTCEFDWCVYTYVTARPFQLLTILQHALAQNCIDNCGLVGLQSFTE